MKQASSLLPVPYAHVVFTVPEQLAPLALRNQRLFYNLLFRAASETLLRSLPILATSALASACLLCCTPGRRTWDIIPICTVSFPPADWRSTAPAGFDQGVTSSCPCACSAACSAASCSPSSSRAIAATNYASPAAGDTLSAARISLPALYPAQQGVGGLLQASLRRSRTRLKYLARYTHRVAISNGRLLGLDNGQVRFRWRDSDITTAAAS